MLLTMKSQTDAARALTLYGAMQLDRARYDRDESLRAAAQKRGDLLIPIIKGWSTELGTSLTSIGVQVHGGVGVVEETGAVQYLRDVRICTIYEGTTGIQASDLVGRKVIATIPRCFSQECVISASSISKPSKPHASPAVNGDQKRFGS
jgi:alkylation response protein AidB-like acyl-CoA dehydrogenase